MRQLIGVSLLIVGIFYLGSAFGLWHNIPPSAILKLWPALLILWGVHILAKDSVWLIVTAIVLVIGLGFIAVLRPDWFSQPVQISWPWTVMHTSTEREFQGSIGGDTTPTPTPSDGFNSNWPFLNPGNFR